MKRHYLAAILLLSVAFCGKKETAPSVDEGYARYPVALYKVPGSVASSDWVVTLDKAEKVRIVEKKQAVVNGKPVDFVRVEVAGGKSGYMQAAHVASDAAVVTSASPRLMQRPLATSGKGHNASSVKPGTIVFIENTSNESGENWFEVKGQGAQFFQGWIRESECTRSTSVLEEAVLLDKSLAVLSNKKAPAKEVDEAKDQLRQLSSSSTEAIAMTAKSAMGEEKEEKKEEPPRETKSGEPETQG